MMCAYPEMAHITSTHISQACIWLSNHANDKGAWEEETNFVTIIAGKERLFTGVKDPLATPWAKF